MVVQAKGGSPINCRCWKYVSCEPKRLPKDCRLLVTVCTKRWLGWSCTRTAVLPLRRDDGCERHQHSCMHQCGKPPGSLADPLPSRLGLSETAVDQPNLSRLSTRSTISWLSQLLDGYLVTKVGCAACTRTAALHSYLERWYQAPDGQSLTMLTQQPEVVGHLDRDVVG